MVDNITGMRYLDEVIGVLQEILNPINLAKNAGRLLYGLFRLMGFISGEENFRQRVGRQSQELWTLITDFINNQSAPSEYAYRIEKFQSVFEAMNRNFLDELDLAHKQAVQVQNSLKQESRNIEGQAINAFNASTQIENLCIATDDFLNCYICLVIFLQIIENKYTKSQLNGKDRNNAFFTLCDQINKKNKPFEVILELAKLGLDSNLQQTEFTYDIDSNKKAVNENATSTKEAAQVKSILDRSGVNSNSHIYQSYLYFKAMVAAMQLYKATKDKTQIDRYFTTVKNFLSTILPNVMKQFHANSSMPIETQNTQDISIFVKGAFETFRAAAKSEQINKNNIENYINILSTFVLTLFFCQSMFKTGLDVIKDINKDINNG